jgi:hypothetical protein
MPALGHVGDLEVSIRRRLRTHLREIGFERRGLGTIDPAADSKSKLRSLHRKARSEHLRQQRLFIKAAFPEFKSRFASGEDISPAAISARLEIVEPQSESSDLFRLASLTWGVPVSQGYGRRLRFLVWDQTHGKLMGLIGLSDPVFNLRSRDVAIGWSGDDRAARLVDVMNAHILGAIPPYNLLLGGKLVACLVRTKEVRDEFAKKYRRKEGVISGKQKKASLVLVTTSSSLGRSAVYDRLRLDNILYYQPTGFTAGWGHFHIPDHLFKDIQKYLRMRHHKYAHGNSFGDGSNWRLRATRAALSLAGMDDRLLRHNVKREVFLCRLATNTDRLLRGEVTRPSYSDLLSVDKVSRLGVERWVVNRAKSRPEYLCWRVSSILDLLNPRQDGTVSLVHGARGAQAPSPSFSVIGSANGRRGVSPRRRDSATVFPPLEAFVDSKVEPQVTAALRSASDSASARRPTASDPRRSRDNGNGF